MTTDPTEAPVFAYQTLVLRAGLPAEFTRRRGVALLKRIGVTAVQGSLRGPRLILAADVPTVEAALAAERERRAERARQQLERLQAAVA